MKSLSSKWPIGTGGGQGPLKDRTADELGSNSPGKEECNPLPYKDSRDAVKVRHGGNS